MAAEAYEPLMPAQRPLTIEEATVRYPDQWVLV